MHHLFLFIFFFVVLFLFIFFFVVMFLLLLLLWFMISLIFHTFIQYREPRSVCLVISKNYHLLRIIIFQCQVFWQVWEAQPSKACSCCFKWLINSNHTALHCTAAKYTEEPLINNGYTLYSIQSVTILQIILAQQANRFSL